MNLKEKKENLMRSLIECGVLRSGRVTEAFRNVPREDFVPDEQKEHAYVNEPLPIAAGQTISQPLTVAAMTEALDVCRGHKILEVGAGSGYQAAILSELAGNGQVITCEIKPEICETARKNLKDYENVTVLHKDASAGYAGEAPYDRIIVTASAPDVPKPLLKQLKKGGKMVIPVGNEMIVINKKNGTEKKMIGHFAFVPLRGKHGAG